MHVLSEGENENNEPDPETMLSVERLDIGSGIECLISTVRYALVLAMLRGL